MISVWSKRGSLLATLQPTLNYGVKAVGQGHFQSNPLQLFAASCGKSWFLVLDSWLLNKIF